MRLVTVAALLVVLASAPSAQTQFADSAGTYVALHRLSSNYGTGLGLNASLGRRLSNGLDYGVQFDFGQSGSRSDGFAGASSAFAAGPTLGLTRGIGAGVLGRVSTAVLYRSSAGTFRRSLATDGEARYNSVSSQSLTGSIAATVSRPVKLYGSLRVQPTVGVLAQASRSLSFETDLDGFEPSRSWGQTGVLLQVPVSVRVLGSDLTIEPGVIVPVTGRSDRYVYAGGGLRLNF